ncbi:hypothetical protein [Lentibacillus cibarius]|uniref:Uncharacterized protein n=1 Tax=Lentibacillus cibarius TaxID=2583219 RepID=A0A5S3R7V2_9BACI|nr:hypothetical protein [Lentibacillus cibarius]TMN22723.1 hypothetical protein FFL34_11910 [Lentibacillus cibarius]
MNKKERRGIHKPVSYKIYPLFKYIFDSCTDVFSTQSFLANALIRESDLFIADEVEEIPAFHKSHLFEKMCDDIKTLDNPIHFEQTTDVYSTERIIELKKVMTEHNLKWNDDKISLMLRVLPNYTNFLSGFTNATIGQVVELAIANFINNCSEFQFKLIKMTFKNRIKQQSENK